jgi:hypothetical protein
MATMTYEEYLTLRGYKVEPDKLVPGEWYYIEKGNEPQDKRHVFKGIFRTKISGNNVQFDNEKEQSTLSIIVNPSNRTDLPNGFSTDPEWNNTFYNMYEEVIEDFNSNENVILITTNETGKIYSKAGYTILTETGKKVDVTVGNVRSRIIRNDIRSSLKVGIPVEFREEGDDWIPGTLIEKIYMIKMDIGSYKFMQHTLLRRAEQKPRAATAAPTVERTNNKIEDLRTKQSEHKIHILFNPNGQKLEAIKTILSLGFDGYIDDRDKYINTIDSIMTKVEDESLCKGKIADDYIGASFNRNDALIILSSKKIFENDVFQKDEKIYGFAIVYFDEDKNKILIDIFCSHKDVKGAGEILIKNIETIAKTLSMGEIYLKSIKSAITFYEKFGFKKIEESCEQMCLMVKSLKTIKDAKGRKTNKHKNARRKRKRTHRK